MRQIIRILVVILFSFHPISARAFVLESTPHAADELRLRDGFLAERLVSIPREEASWISMTFDPQGRIIVSDQGSKMHRITPAKIDEPNSRTRVERIDLGVSGAHGLLYTMNHLYAVLGGYFPEPGLYRMQDLDGRGDFAKPERLMTIPGQNEHGPHGIVLGPNRQWLYLIAGNGTLLPTGITRDHVSRQRPTQGSEGPGHEGFVLRISLDGQQRELFCEGMRNAYDLAFNTDGELFTYDSDSEGFMGLPWYRPNTLLHLVSGADYGWRNGPNNLTSDHPDRRQAVREMGAGSPTALVFGTNSKFPQPYQQALFACDWSWGRVFVFHIQPDGASYRAEPELFASGRPLAATDLQFGPDGALYLITGGRGTQSHLYRIRWSGDTTEQKRESHDVAQNQRQKRHQLEDLNGRHTATAVETAWQSMNDPDEAIRYAARVALEHQPINKWRPLAVSAGTDQSAPRRMLAALLALVRQEDTDRLTPIFEGLKSVNWESLDLPERLALLRVYSIALDRVSESNEAMTIHLPEILATRFPASDNRENRELATLLFQLQHRHGETPELIDRTLGLVERAPTLMQQIHFLTLIAASGENRLTKTHHERLRHAVDPFELRAIADRAYGDQQQQLQRLINEIGLQVDSTTNDTPRPLVQDWTTAELLPLLDDTRADDETVRQGQQVFRDARCSQCHRIRGTGGVLGPNLTGLPGRLTPREILESIVEPNRVVSDQYMSTIFEKQDGTVITGRIVNLQHDGYLVQIDPYRPFARIVLPFDEVEQTSPAKSSPMPTGTLNTFTKSEIRALLSFLHGTQPNLNSVETSH